MSGESQEKPMFSVFPGSSREETLGEKASTLSGEEPKYQVFKRPLDQQSQEDVILSHQWERSFNRQLTELYEMIEKQTAAKLPLTEQLLRYLRQSFRMIKQDCKALKFMNIYLRAELATLSANKEVQDKRQKTILNPEASEFVPKARAGSSSSRQEDSLTERLMRFTVGTPLNTPGEMYRSTIRSVENK